MKPSANGTQSSTQTSSINSHPRLITYGHPNRVGPTPSPTARNTTLLSSNRALSLTTVICVPRCRMPPKSATNGCGILTHPTPPSLPSSTLMSSNLGTPSKSTLTTTLLLWDASTNPVNVDALHNAR